MRHYSKLLLGTILALSIVAVTCVPASAKKEAIKEGAKVKFDYVLKVDGQVVETTEGKQPIEYTHGQGALIPGLENELLGLKAGDKKNVKVAAADGYGEINPEAYKEMPKNTFPEDFVPQVGLILEFTDPKGNKIPGVLTEIKDESLMVSFNHPLAGKVLEFDVEVVSIEK